MDNPLSRRLITVPTVVIVFTVVSAGLPFLLSIGLMVDLVRAIVSRRAAMASRTVVFLWLYLLGEVLALIALAAVSWLRRQRRIDITFRLQAIWAAWTFNSMRWVFDLQFVAEGLDEVAPAPIVVLARHASIVDTMLPARYVARANGIALRYVLKKELLVDPVLDIGGNRLPNHFVDRQSRDLESEMAAIRALGAGLTARDGVMIYPEGTRYSEEKRQRYVAPLIRKGGVVGEAASGYCSVLPPRPGGTLALLETTTCDVVVLAHRGLEGFATVRDIWSGDLVGSRIDVRLWRVPREDIPESRSLRVDWLFRLWAEVDDWVSQVRYVR